MHRGFEIIRKERDWLKIKLESIHLSIRLKEEESERARDEIMNDII